MKNKTIFVITVFEMCGEENSSAQEQCIANIACTRTPCFKHTFEEAEEIVLNNIGDIWETCYDYAVIEEIDTRIYPRYITRKFYKFNSDTYGYEPTKEINLLHRTLVCGIG